MNTEDKVKRVADMREMIELLKYVHEFYEDSGQYVNAMNMGSFIVRRQKELDFYIAKNFPIVEVK